MRLAEERDPLSAIGRATTGLVLHFFSEFEAAAAECRDGLELNADFAAAQWALAKTVLGLGDTSAASDCSSHS